MPVMHGLVTDAMKRRAEYSKDTPAVFVAEAHHDLSDDAKAVMMQSDAIKRTLRNRRIARHPPQPKSL